MKTNIEQKRKFIDNQDEDLIESMLLLHTSCAKDTYGRDAIVVLNEGVPCMYDNNPIILEFKDKGYELCDANCFGTDDRVYEALTFRKKQ